MMYYKISYIFVKYKSLFVYIQKVVHNATILICIFNLQNVNITKTILKQEYFCLNMLHCKLSYNIVQQ